MNKEISAYHRALSAGDRAICDKLRAEIERGLPDAESKIWHGAPVWFLDGNPIVGYHKLKDCVRLLFWSGQSFEEAGLQPEGKFKAAEVRYMAAEQVVSKHLQRWLKKSRAIQWDYKNIVKRRGRLVKLAADEPPKAKKTAAKTAQAPGNSYKNGQLISEQKGNTLTYYFKTGEIKAQGRFVNGMMQGKWIFNRESGQLWQIGHFKDNMKHGTFVRYDRNGEEEYHAEFSDGRLTVKK
ncbi:DUF1801 domain-containing protein [bacterium]|nr:DUF1801 domain-containing protein [bacterium]